MFFAPRPSSLILLFVPAVVTVGTAASGLWGCTRPSPPDRFTPRAVHHSFADSSAVVRHVALDLTVDFSAGVLHGTATHSLSPAPGARRVVLDTRDLEIEAVTLGPGGIAPAYRLGDEVALLGRPLMIELPPDADEVTVRYRTRPGAAALQFLDAAQTVGRTAPLLFTQSQPILARTWIPCQDNPSVRMTYEAIIRVPPGMLALMSASNPAGVNPDGVYTFTMEQPIPAYLFALAAGDLAFRTTGPCSGVYAEPSFVDTCAWEFADTERMIAAAEKLYGAYRWGRYDLLVLPPSFPYGGMENPRLTFASPTVVAGDRSLVALVAHELAHSWSGNLVTNATWDDFWLNEGFTLYFERRILEEVYGREFSETEAVIGRKELERELMLLGPDSPDTRLKVDTEGRDPDEGSGVIPYEKGYLFLRLIEETVGRARWDGYLRSYFDRHAFQSMTTERFLADLRAGLVRGERWIEDSLRIDAWVYGAGIPSNAPVARSRSLDEPETLAASYALGESTVRPAAVRWTTQQRVHFLRKLPPAMPAALMRRLDAEFRFSESRNADVGFEWFLHVIASRYEPAYAALESYLSRIGRRKFVKPLYEALAETPDGLVRARDLFSRARSGYHPVTAESIEASLHRAAAGR